MRGTVSKGGGNASLARGGTTSGRQGVHREVESEGLAEKCRAVVEGATPGRTGRPKVGQGRACTMEAKAFSFTHCTKVFAGGTAWKDIA
jgi:hypothetical protein